MEAIDKAEIADALLAKEVEAGWIAEVEGGDCELGRRCSVSSVGKLGVATVPGHPPRLVVDSLSIVSVVTSDSNTHFDSGLPQRQALLLPTHYFECVSSLCWSRWAGILLRLIKRLIRVRHSGLIYVDDFLTLTLLNRLSAPSWASVIRILFLGIKVPVLRKASLTPSVVWFGCSP